MRHFLFFFLIFFSFCFAIWGKISTVKFQNFTFLNISLQE